MNNNLKDTLSYLAGIPTQLIEEFIETQSISALQTTAVELAAALQLQIGEYVKNNNLTVHRVLRNLLADAPASTIPDLCHLIKYWSLYSKLKITKTILSALRQVAEKNRKKNFFSWLILGGKTPTAKQVVMLFEDYEILGLLCYLKTQGRVHSQAETVKMFRILHRSNRYMFIDERDIDLNLIKDCYDKKHLAQLNEAYFDMLPVSVRKWMVVDWVIAKKVLTANFYAKIKNHPYEFKGTREYIWFNEELPQVLSRLKNREFDFNFQGQFDGLIERKDVDKYTERILEALSSRPRTVSSYYGEEINLNLKILSTLCNRRLVNALKFFSSPISSRMSELSKLSKTDLSRLINDVSYFDFAKAINECRSKTYLNVIKEILFEHALLKKELFKFLFKKETNDILFDLLVNEYIQTAACNDILKLCSLRHETFNAWKPECFEENNFQKALKRIVSRSNLISIFLNNITENTSHFLANSNAVEIAMFRSELTTKVRLSRNEAVRLSFLKLMMLNSGGLVILLANWEAKKEEFDFLLKQSISLKSPELIKAVLSLVDRKGVPCWNAFTKKGKSVRRISRAIRKYRPDLHHSLENAEAQWLLKNTKFKKKLQSVLLGKAHAQTLGVSQTILRHFVTWARKKWAKKPTVAVAYELALSFSIKDSRYLLYLCTARWCSNNRFDGGKVFDHLYTTYDLPKKSGGKRTVTVPDDRLKRLQRRLLWNGFEKHEIHTASHGFVRGRSILTNAKEHLGQPLVVNIDIESFFPNTRYSHILRVCSQLLNGELSEGARRIVADLCSYNGALPTGAPTSPAISNIVLKPVDEAVSKAATENGIVYTRYADDLTFSGKSNTPKILPFVGRVLAQYGYRIEERKTNLFRKGRRQIVTGLVVNEKPNLPRKIRRKLRAAIHVRSKDGTPHWHGKPMNDAELVGRVSFLNLVQPEEAQKHLDILTNNNKSTH